MLFVLQSRFLVEQFEGLCSNMFSPSYQFHINYYMDYSGDYESRASDRFDLYAMNSDQLTSKVYRSWWKFFFWVCTVCMGSFYIGFTNTFAFTLMTNQNMSKPVSSKFWFLVQVGFYCLAGVAGALITNKMSKKLSRRY